MEYRPVVNIEYLLPLVQHDSLAQLAANAALAHGVHVVYLYMMAGQVLLVCEGVYQHRRTHLRRLHPGLCVRFGLLAVDRVVRVWPWLTQLLAQPRAEVVTRGRMPNQDGGRFVGTLRKRIGGFVDDVFRDRCRLYEVDEIAHVAAKESATREPRVVVQVAAVHCELQLGTRPQHRFRLAPVRALP